MGKNFWHAEMAASFFYCPASRHKEIFPELGVNEIHLTADHPT